MVDVSVFKEEDYRAGIQTNSSDNEWPPHTTSLRRLSDHLSDEKEEYRDF